MYYLLTQEYPFKIDEKAKTDLEMHQNLVSQEVSFDLPVFQTFFHLSDLQQLLKGLLDKNPLTRISASDALKHRIFKLAKIQLNQ